MTHNGLPPYIVWYYVICPNNLTNRTNRETSIGLLIFLATLYR